MKRLKKIIALLLAILIVFISIRFLFFKPEKIEAAWYSGNWTYRVKLTIDHNKVGADQTNFSVYVNLLLLPADFHNHVNQTDARDIRVTTSDGVTELPREVVYYTSATDRGELYFKYSGTLSSSIDTSIYIYYGNPEASDYAANATYGKNNVWDSSYSGVHHWQASSYADSTAGAHNGSNTGSTSTTGFAGDARLFDAINERVLIAMSGYIHATVGTVSFWYKSTSDAAANWDAFFGSSQGDSYFQLQDNDSYTQLTSGIGGAWNTGWATSINVYDNSWHLLSLDYNTTTNTQHLYIDGQSQGTDTDTIPDVTISTYNLIIGTSPGYGSPCLGAIDEFRVSNNLVRSSTWISTEYNNQSSPSTFFTNGSEEKKRGSVLNFTFDEGYGTTAHDSSPNGYIGTLTGSPTWQPEDLCISGKCLYYEGSAAYTSVTTSVPNVQSVSFWVKPKTNGEALVDFDGGSHKLSASGGGITATGFTSYYVNGIASGTLTANTWQHIEATTSTAFTASAITIGKATTYLNGFIDEFKIYDYARTAAQVKLDYNSRNSQSGVGVRFGPDTGKTLSSGLVGYWRMDEASGNPSDSSGVGTTLTNVSTTAFVSGKYAKAADPDGAADYFYAADNASLSIAGDLTVSAWINPDTVSAGSYDIAGKWDYISSADHQSYLLQQSGDEIVMYIDSINSYVTTDAVNMTAAGGWYHVVATYKAASATVSVFVNGQPVAATTTGTIPTSIGDDTDRFHIGAEDSSTTTNNFYNGQIDEARVYNRALSSAEVSQLYNFAPGPVGWWRLDDNTLTTANDSSGNANVSTTWSGDTKWIIGKFGSALSFDGNDDVVGFTETTSTDLGTLTDSYTVESWFKTSASPPTSAILVCKNDNSVNYPFCLFVQNPTNKLCFFMTGTTSLCSPSTVTDGLWHHGVGVRDVNNDKLFIYIDGVLVNQTTDNSVASYVNDDLITIGNGGPSNIAWDYNGLIDDVKIYNYARTAGQIIEDMNAGHPAPGSPVGSALGYWKFDEGAANTCSGGANDACNSGSQTTTLDGAFGATTAAPTYTNSGKFGKGLTFDGSDDVVSLGTATAIDDLPTGGMSISTWIYPTSIGENSRGIILAKNSGATPSSGWILQTVATNAIKFSVDGSTDLVRQTSNSTITLNAWNHVVLTWDGVITTAASADIYINGVETSYATTTNGAAIVSDAASTMYLGNDSAGTSTFAGTIDETKVYNFPLTSDQIKVLYNQNSGASMGSLSTDSTGLASNADVDSYCPPGQGTACAAPVLHWKLDENTGTAAYDTTGNNNQGTLTNTPKWLPGKYGAGLDFAGSNQHVTIADASQTGLDFAAASAFTIETWFKHGPATAVQTMVSKMVTSDNDGGYKLKMEADGDITCETDDDDADTTIDDTATTTAATYDDGVWHHVACVYDVANTKMYIYIDGVLTASDASISTNSLANDDAFFYGIDVATGTEDWIGQLDDLRVYNVARSQAQIAWDYNRGAPVGWWKMDECTGDTLYDASLTGAGAAGGKNGTRDGTGGTNTSSGTCTVVDTATAWYNGRSGKFNGSLDFDGGGATPDDKVTVTNASAIDFNEGLQNGFTFSAWIYPESDGEGDAGRIFDKGNTYCRLATDTTVSCIVDLATDELFSATTLLTANAWNHVAFSWTNDADDEVTIWVNGIASTSVNKFAGDAAAESTALTIGNIAAQSATFDGKIDDFRIYNYELTAQQIKTVMGEGAVRFGPSSGLP